MAIEPLAFIEAIELVKGDLPAEWGRFCYLARELFALRQPRQVAPTPQECATACLAGENTEVDRLLAAFGENHSFSRGRVELLTLKARFGAHVIEAARAGRVTFIVPDGAGERPLSPLRLAGAEIEFAPLCVKLVGTKEPLPILAVERDCPGHVDARRAALIGAPEVPAAMPARERRKRGPKPEIFDAAVQRMQQDLAERKLTPIALQDMKQEALASRYGVNRETAVKARSQVLSQLSELEITTRIK